VLIWTPPATVDPAAVTIEILDADSEIIPCTLTPQATNARGQRRLLITNAAKRPSFARLRHPAGLLSATAVVALLDELRDVAREARTKRVEDAATRLGEKSEEGLWLLDVINTLEAAEHDQHAPQEPVLLARKGKKDKEEQGAGAFRKLSYHEFIAGRRPREAHSSLNRNSLSGSELFVVRGFINRLLGLGGEDIDKGEADLPGNAFDLGDETANPEETIKYDILSSSKKDPDEDEKEKQRVDEQKRRAQRKASKKEMIDAAESFIKRLSQRKTDGSLNTFDVLRLRVMLMIVAAAGWDGKEPLANPQSSLTSLQVLPVQDDAGNSWPRVLGRTLFGFFGGNDPVIRHVQIEAVHDQLSADMLECWATCFWAVQACLNAPVTQGERETFTRFFLPAAERAYRLTGLTSGELLAEDIRLVMEKVTERFGKRLGLDGKVLTQGHEALVRKIYAR
jgi:hypothetical protein